MVNPLSILAPDDPRMPKPGGLLSKGLTELRGTESLLSSISRDIKVILSLMAAQ